jgi:hypothetical protein
MSEDHAKFKILGQEIPYPCSWPAVAGVAIISLLLAFMSWVVLVKAGHEHISAVCNFIQHKFSPMGEIEAETSFRLIQFWTPSEKTQRDIVKDGKVPEARKWEVVNEEKVNLFGSQLAQHHGVIGHRRCEIAGQGRSGFKHGWWWIATVKNDLKLNEFARFYSAYWGSPIEVYFEEYRAAETH